MNVIVMAVLTPCPALDDFGTIFQHSGNTMCRKQFNHHVTLAYKPDNPEEVRLFYGRATHFMPRTYYYRDDISAVFGDIVDADGVALNAAPLHVTMGGTVPPVTSRELPTKHTIRKDVAKYMWRLPVTIEIVPLGGRTA